jgi:hypothetical protein
MRGSVRIIHDDQDSSSTVANVLSDKVLVVSELRDTRPIRTQSEVTRLKPEGMLIDCSDGGSDGSSSINAAGMLERNRFIPVIVFTAGLETCRQKGELA